MKSFLSINRSSFLPRKIFIEGLETCSRFSNFPRAGNGPDAPRGFGETGTEGVRWPLVPILLIGGFGYEDFIIRLRPVLAIVDRV